MNQAGVFAPDVNFSPAAAVYPTAAGGTSAAAASAMSATTNVAVQDSNGGAAPATITSSPLPTSGSTVWYWLGFVVLLLVLVFVARKAGGEEDFRNLKPTFYNFMAITLTSIVGITGMKVIATKYRIPGASDVILAV